MPFQHIIKGLPSCLPSSSPVVNFQPIGANFRQKGAKVNDFLGVLGVFSGKSETEKGKNKNLFYFRGFRGAAFILFCGGGGGVHWWQVAQGAGAQDLPEVGFGPLVVCSLPFVRSLALLVVGCLQICLYLRF